MFLPWSSSDFFFKEFDSLKNSGCHGNITYFFFKSLKIFLSKTITIEQEIPDLYPSSAVTRAMAKKAILKDSNSDIDLTDTFIGQYFNNEIKKSFDPSLSDTQTDSSMSCHSPPRSTDQGHDTLSKSQLIQEQQTDPEISKLIFRALPEDEISQLPMCYYIKNGILMRKWRPFDVPADDEWAVDHQIVVPKSYRHEILSIAHESPM